MDFFAQFKARMQQFNSQLLSQVRSATANIPAGESGIWVNGQKVSALPSLPIGTHTTVSNGSVVTQTVSLTDAIASFRTEGSGVTVIQFGGTPNPAESMLARAQ